MSQYNDRYRSGGGKNSSVRSYGGASSRSRSSSPGRSGKAQSKRRNYSSGNRRRKPPRDYLKLGLIIAALLAVIAAVVIATKSCDKDAAVAGTQTTPEETELQKNVTVDGISITGLSRQDARELLLKNYSWDMKVVYEDKEEAVQNLMGEKVDNLLTEIFTGEPKDSYFLDTSGLEEAIRKEVENIAEKWDKPAKNGEISGFDKETKSFIYTSEENGRIIDRVKLEGDISKAVQEKRFDATMIAEARDVAPEITKVEAKDMYQVIGSYTTITTDNKNRNTNIQLACDSLEGLILYPGEEFSFNKTTGERTEAKGYKPAGAYQDGKFVEEPGGGVCQVSSTLYNAVIFSGLTTTERHAHSYEPSYVTPGEDAMVSYGGPDMKFVNKTNTAIAIRASFANKKLTISIVGIPILEKGVKISMHSEKVAELDPPAPEYEEDQTLEPGVEVEAKAAVKGSRWVTNLIKSKDGEVVSDEFFHNSTYRGKPATIKRNTSGVVVKSTDESGSSDISAESSSGENAFGPVNEGVGESSADATLPGGESGQATRPSTAESFAQPSTTTAAEPGAQQTKPGTAITVPPNPGPASGGTHSGPGM